MPLQIPVTLPAGEYGIGSPELLDLGLRALVPFVHAGLPVGTEVAELMFRLTGSTIGCETVGLIPTANGMRLKVGPGLRRTEDVILTENLAGAKNKPLPKTTRVKFRIYPAMPALPLRAGARVMAIGDSQVGYNNYGGTAIGPATEATRAIGSLGYGSYKHAQWADPRFDFASWISSFDMGKRNIEGGNQGIFGDHMQWATNQGGILGRLRKLLVAGRLPELLILEGGTNTIATGDDGVAGTSAYVIERLDACLDLARYAGIPVVIQTIYPRGGQFWDASKTNTAKAVNAWIRAQATRDGVVGIIDPWDYLAPNGIQDTTLFMPSPDLTHLNNRGACRVGRQFVLPALQAVIAAGRAPGMMGLNLLPAALASMAGTVGGKGSGVTGQVANSLNVTIAGNAVSVVASKEGAVGSEKQVLAITPGAGGIGSANWGEVTFSMGTAAIDASARKAGSWFVRGVTVEVSGPDCLSELRLTGGVRGGGATLTNSHVGQVFSGDFDKPYVSNSTYVLLSDPFQSPEDMAAPDSLAQTLFIRFDKAGQPFTVKVSEPFLRQVDDPRPLWGWPTKGVRLNTLAVSQSTFLAGTTASDMTAFVTGAGDGSKLTMNPPSLEVGTTSFTLIERHPNAPEAVTSGPFACNVIRELQDLTLPLARVTPGVQFDQAIQNRAGGSTIAVAGLPSGWTYTAGTGRISGKTTFEGIIVLSFTETFGTKTRSSKFYLFSSALDYDPYYTGGTVRMSVDSDPTKTLAVYNHSAFAALSIGRSKKDPNVFSFAITRKNEGWGGDNKKLDKQRSEFCGQSFYPFKQDIWLHYKLRLWATDLSQRSWLVLGQLHAFEDVGDSLDTTDAGSSPPFELTYMNGALRFNTRSTTVQYHKTNPPVIERLVIPTPLGTWTDLVMKLVLDPFGTGSFQAWVNGVDKGAVLNIPFGYNDRSGPYWKWGIYSGPKLRDPETVVLAEYAKMEIGGASLLNRVANPYQIAA